MTEEEYLDKIDASLPYKDKSKWIAVIDEGVGISAQAAYGALEEICAAPSEVAKSDLEEMAEYWSSRFDHPLKSMVLKMARAWIRGIGVSDDEVLSAMDIISEYRGLSKALLAIAGPPLDWSDTVNDRYMQIVSNWKAH